MSRKLALAALLALAGCGSLLDPGADDAALRSDETSYAARHQAGEGWHRRYGFTLVARFENRTGGTVHLDRCYPDWPHPTFAVGLVGAAGSPPGSAYDPVWACVGHDSPIVVLPGETRVDTLRILGPSSWDGRTLEPQGAFDGRFRLVYKASGGCRDHLRCPLSRESSISNAFEVRVER
ncbi:MAG: hypothetical protein AB1941_15070 [Gemmatimonadota bacterium]